MRNLPSDIHMRITASTITTLLTLLLLMSACGHRQQYAGMLSQADSLLDRDQVERAADVLDSIDSMSLSTAEDSAYYFLLRTQIRYRQYLPADTPERLDFAVRVFSAGGDRKKASAAYFYKAALLYEDGDVERAVRMLKKAEYLARDVEDCALSHKICELFTVINDEADEYATALEYARRSADVSAKAGRKTWLAQASNNMAALYDKLGEKDSSALCLRRSMALLREIPQAHRAYILNNIGAHLSQTNPRLAEKYLTEVNGIRPMAEAYDNLAQIKAREGRTEEAERLWQKALTLGDAKMRNSVLRELFDLQAGQGRYQRAVMTARRLTELNDSMQTQRATTNVKAIQAELDRIRLQQDYEYRIAMGTSVMVTVVLLCVIALLYLRNKAYRAKAAIAIDQMMIKELEAQTARLRQEGSDREKEIAALNRRRDRLMERHRDTLVRGYQLYSSVKQGATTVMWRKDDFESVVEYYRLVDTEFVALMETSYEGLSPKQMFFLVMEHEGMSDSQLTTVMCVAEVTLRSIRSRINKKMRD